MPHYISADGLEKIKAELNQMKTVKRRQIAERIKEAKDLGDLSENAEYVDAKDEQSFMEGQILELEELVKNAAVIQDQSGGSLVQIGSSIQVKSPAGAQVFSIVGSQEANPATGKISNESPLGQALVGHRVGETVSVQTPRGLTKYEIVKIL